MAEMLATVSLVAMSLSWAILHHRNAVMVRGARPRRNQGPGLKSRRKFAGSNPVGHPWQTW